MIHRPLATILIAAFLVASPGASGGVTVVYVDADAAGSDNGNSWCDAYRFLQDALAAPWAPGTTAKEIQIASGRYYPDSGSGQLLGDRSATFLLRDYVSLVGGFSGCGAADPDERDPQAHPTILSGDIGITGLNLDNSFHVVTGSGAGPTAVVDGLTVTGGYANGQPDHLRGAGILVVGGSPRFVNCAIEGNVAGQDDYVFPDGEGAGVYCQDGQPTFEDCEVGDNVVYGLGDGAGILMRRCQAAITRCEIRGNFIDTRNSDESGPRTTGGSGAGICSFDGDVTITNCKITGNTAGEGGTNHETDEYCGGPGGSGGGVFATGTAHLMNCLISVNNAGQGGPSLIGPSGFRCEHGGDGGSGGGVSGDGDISLVNCTIVANRAGEGGCGAAKTCGSTGQGDGVAFSGASLTNCHLWNSRSGSSAIRYSNILGGAPGPGNISLDPFGDPTPFINAGDPFSHFEPGTIDLAGNPRVLCGRVDIGAYEFLTNGCDGMVSIADYAAWQACLTGPDAGPNALGCEAFDFDADGDVDLQDFTDVQMGFLPQ